MSVNLRPLAIIVVLGAGVLATACNDDNNNGLTGSSPTTPVATPTPGPTPTPEPSPTPSPEAISFVGVVKDVQGGNLFVSGQSVAVTTSTTFMHEDGSPWSFSDLHIGDHVRVRGIQADGYIAAERITSLS